MNFVNRKTETESFEICLGTKIQVPSNSLDTKKITLKLTPVKFASSLNADFLKSAVPPNVDPLKSAIPSNIDLLKSAYVWNLASEKWKSLRRFFSLRTISGMWYPINFCSSVFDLSFQSLANFFWTALPVFWVVEYAEAALSLRIHVTVYSAWKQII